MLRMLATTTMTALLLTCAISASQAEQPAGHPLDWFNWSNVSASPYVMNMRALADGNLETSSGPMGGPQIGGWIAFDEFIKPDSRATTRARVTTG